MNQDERQINMRMISLLAGKLPLIGQRAFLKVIVKELSPSEPEQTGLLKDARAQAEGELYATLPFEKVRR